MGKLAVVGATVIAGGGTAVGGVVLSKMFSFDSTLPETVDEFTGQKDEKIEGCVQNLFPGIKSMEKPNSDISSSDSVLDKSKKENVSGCLVINGTKDEYKVDSNDKGVGKFRLLWAAQQDDKGFIVFTTAETTKETTKQLLGKGIAYSLGKTGEEGKVTKKKEVDSNGKKVNKDSTDTKFPKAKEGLTEKPFWGFMKDKEDIDQMCESSNCTDDKKTSSSRFEGYGVWSGGPVSGTANPKFGEGTSQLSGGWEELFTNSELNMGELVQEMTGKWEQKVWSGPN